MAAKPTIMIVEDDVPYANGMADTIKTANKYEVLVAYSAKEAFDLLKKSRRLMGLSPNRIRLILLDIKMPEMDGLQFLAEMRKQYSQDKIGVIMVTAYEDEEKWEKATDNWAVGYITKPFESKKLLAAIERFFSSEKSAIDMSIDTIYRHIQKREEFRKKKEQPD